MRLIKTSVHQEAPLPWHRRLEAVGVASAWGPACCPARETAKGDSLLILRILSQLKLPKMNLECLVMAKCSRESGGCLSVLRPESWLLG